MPYDLVGSIDERTNSNILPTITFGLLKIRALKSNRRLTYYTIEFIK